MKAAGRACWSNQRFYTGLILTPGDCRRVEVSGSSYVCVKVIGRCLLSIGYPSRLGYRLGDNDVQMQSVVMVCFGRA